MRLRLLLMACVALALVVVGLALVSLTLDARRAEVLDRKRTATEVMARDAAGLLVLTQDYLLHGNPRAVSQWQVVHRDLVEAMDDYAAVGEPQERDMARLRDVALNLLPLFESLQRMRGAAPGPVAQARYETLAGQLVNETRRISDGAFDLSEFVTEKRRAAQSAQRRWAVATQMAQLMLTLALAGLLLHRVLGPLARLRQGALAVQHGDLGVRVGYQGSDELAQLAQAFDAMTAALDERGAALQASHERLQRSEAFQERVSGIAGVGGWELEIDSGRLAWSAQTRALHEVDEGFKPRLQTALAFFAPEAQQALQAALHAARAHGQPWDLELPFTTARGRGMTVRMVGAAELRAGRVVRLVGALQDVSARRADAETLRQATRAAEAANEAKSAFLVNMSHEIRTPLNAMIGLSYLLEQTALDAGQQALLAKVKLAGRTLLDVINDVLDLAKIEAGELQLEQAPFDLRQLLDDLLGLFAPQAVQRGITLHGPLVAELPQHLSGDALRLRQVLTNLLSNAMKFTPRGEVRLAVETLDADARPLRLRFVVEDNGIGMGPEVQQRLFTPFMQADASTTRRFGGTGLGLSIVKRLVALLGGEISLHSASGAGSRFEVTLPFDTASGDAGNVEAPLQVLVAAHNAAQRGAWLDLCQLLGWHTETADDGPSLLARVRQRGHGGGPFDAVLVDGGLPGLDGQRGLQALFDDAAAPDSNGLRPAVVVVNSGGSDATTRALDATQATQAAQAAQATQAAQADEVSDDPKEASALFNAVRTAVQRRGGPAGRVLLASALDSAGVARLPGVCVLVVDDSGINLEVVQRILEQEGAEVHLAHNGAQAVAVLREHLHAVDIVLMDLQMPVLDGLSAARQIRGELGLLRLPLLALTASALPSERQLAIEAGMDGFVSKPFEPRALVGLLHQQVEAARGVPLRLAPRQHRPGGSATIANWPVLEGIDRADAYRRVGGDLRLFARLLDLMCEEFADLMLPPAPATDPALDTAPATRMHKLAGTAGLLGALRLRRVAAAAERGLRSGAEGAQASTLRTEVSAALRSLVDGSATWLAQARQQREAELEQRALLVATESPDDAGLAQWKQQLRANDLAALPQFERLAPGLRAQLGAERFAAASAAMDRLAFARVLALLESAAA